MANPNIVPITEPSSRATSIPSTTTAITAALTSLNLTPEQEVNPNLKQAAEDLTAALASLQVEQSAAETPQERRLRDAADEVHEFRPVVAVLWAKYHFLEQRYLHIPPELREHPELPKPVREWAAGTLCPSYDKEHVVEKMLLTHVTDALRTGEEQLREGSADEAVLAVEIGKYFMEQVERMLSKCEESVVAHERLLQARRAG